MGLLMVDFMSVHRFFFILLICACVLCGEAAHAGSRVEMVTGEWAPYTSIQAAGGGSATKLIVDAFASQDKAVDISFSPWKRAYKLAKTGDVEGSFPWVWSQKRAEDFYFSNPIMFAKFYFYHRANHDFDWNDLSDLKGLTVGLTRGSYVERMSSAAEKYGFELSINDSDIVNFKLLMDGRIDAFPMDSVVAEHLLKSHFSQVDRAKIAQHPKVYFQAPLSAIFSKSARSGKELVETLNRGLQHVRSQSSDVTLSIPLNVAFAHWPPWKIINGDRFSGIDADILREVGRRTGLTFNFVACPWKRCIALLQSGDVDMITSFSETSERREFACYVGEPYATEKVVFYKKKGSRVVVEKVADLARYTIGQVAGARFYPEYDERKGLRRTLVSDEAQLFKMLENERIDVFIGYESQIDYQVGVEGYGGAFEKCSLKKDGGSSNFALTKTRDLSAYEWLLRKAIREMLEDGTIQKIISSYSGL